MWEQALASLQLRQCEEISFQQFLVIIRAKMLRPSFLSFSLYIIQMLLEQADRTLPFLHF